jgi:DNA-binding LacI/PurR family transcriptional regulator
VRRLTIKDVAEIAGVSTSTVSRVLSDSPLVSDDTRKKVLKVVRELNFSPNVVARALKKRESSTIGLLVPDIVNPYFAEIARGVEDIAHKSGYSVVLCNYDADTEKEKKYLQVLLQRQIDGLIYAGSGLLAGSIVNLLQAGIPTVLLDRDTSEILDVDTVCIDDESAAQLAVDHLISLGHREIAVLSGPEYLNSSRGRLAGYKLSLARSAIDFKPELVVSGPFTTEAGFELVTKLVRSGARFTAVFAMSDMMAIGAIKGLQRLNLRVPEDIAVVGFDNIKMSELITPELTTVAQPMYELGSQAFAILKERLDARHSERQRIVLKTRLIVRDSCGANLRTDKLSLA